MTYLQYAKAAVLGIALAFISIVCPACSGSKAQGNQKESSAGAATAASPVSVDVTTAVPVVRQLPRYFEATGSLAADEQTDVAPAIGGKVVAIGVDLGSYVQRGTVLIRLDDRDARIRLEQAEAQLSQSEAAVRQAEEKIGLQPGQNFDPTRVADVRAARVALDLADLQLRRFDRLVESGDVSRSAYDQQKAQRDQLQQQYNVAIEQARQNYAAIVTARAAVDAARAQIAQARKNIADAVVTSPINGYVADRPANLGEYVSTSSKVATIVRTNPLRLRIDIPEQALGSARVGATVAVNVSAYPDRQFTGHVARISPSVTAASRTMTVEADVENPEGLLKPGQFATVRIQQPGSEPALLVPQRAVRTESDSSRVFVIRNGHAEQRLVQVGQPDGDLVEIKGDVKPDEAVATSSVEQLSDGMPVRQ